MGRSLFRKSQRDSMAADPQTDICDFARFLAKGLVDWVVV
jgi:hypothetical protein